jgi:hypothetical protein
MPSTPTPISRPSALSAKRGTPIRGIYRPPIGISVIISGFSDESIDSTPWDQHNNLSQFHSGKSLPYKGRISREGD